MLLCLLVLFPGPASLSTKCDTKLIQSFHLSGIQYSQSDRMQICPTVFERCCSVTDEINILKYWREYAETRLKTVAQQLYVGYETVTKYVDHLLKFTENDMIVNAINYRWILYPHRNVESNALTPRLNRRMLNLSFNAFLPGRGRVRKYVKGHTRSTVSNILNVGNRARARVALMMYLAAIARTITQHFQNYEAYVEWLESEARSSRVGLNDAPDDDERRLLLTNFKKAMAKDVIRQKRRLEQHFEKVSQELAADPAASALIPDLQRDYQNRFIKLLDEMKLFMSDLKLDNESKEYIKRVKKAKIDIRKELGQVDKLIKLAGKKGRKLREVGGTTLVQPRKLKGSEGGDDKAAGEVPLVEDKPAERGAGQPPSERVLTDRSSRRGSNRHKTSHRLSRRHRSTKHIKHQSRDKTQHINSRASRVKTVGHRRRRHASQSGRRSRRHLQDNDEQEQQHQPQAEEEEDPERANWMNNVAPRFQRIFNRLMEFHLSLPTVRNRRPARPPRVVLPINISHAVLRTRTMRRSFMRGLLLTNVPKIKFCYRIHEEFKAYNHARFVEEIHQFFPINKNIMGLKKSLYCAICDANLNRNFVHQAGLIVLDDEFCLDMIERYSDYLRWKHIKLVEYFDLIYQYLSCLESDGWVSHFPFRSFLDRYKRRIDFMQRCLEIGGQRGNSYMAACHFLCTDFKLQGVSRLWDADLSIARNMVYVLYNSVRKHNWAPDDKVSAMKLLIETDLAFDDRWTSEHRDVNYNPPADDDLPSMVPSSSRVLKLSPSQRNQKMAELGTRIDEIQGELEMLKSRSERGLKDGPKPNEVEVAQKRQKAERLMKEAEALGAQLASLPEVVAFNPLTGERPDLKSKPDIQKPKGKAAARKAKSSTDTTASQDSLSQASQTHPSKPNKRSRKAAKKSANTQADEQALLTQLNTRAASRKLVGRKLSSGSLPKKEPTRKTSIVAEPGLSLNEFYEKRDNTYDLAHYRSFYTTQTPALHPLKLSAHLDFHFANITGLLESKYHSFQNERISRLSVMLFVKVSEEAIAKFNGLLMEPVKIMYGVLKGSTYDLVHQQTPLPREYEVLKDNLDGEDEEDREDKKEDDDMDVEEKTVILPPGSFDPYDPKDTNSLDSHEVLGNLIINKKE